jgi:hypothetical protein
MRKFPWRICASKIETKGLSETLTNSKNSLVLGAETEQNRERGTERNRGMSAKSKGRDRTRTVFHIDAQVPFPAFCDFLLHLLKDVVSAFAAVASHPFGW